MECELKLMGNGPNFYVKWAEVNGKWTEFYVKWAEVNGKWAEVNEK
jgi:hypothetical protein